MKAKIPKIVLKIVSEIANGTVGLTHGGPAIGAEAREKTRNTIELTDMRYIRSQAVDMSLSDSTRFLTSLLRFSIKILIQS